MTRLPSFRAVEADEVASGLAIALAGGPPIAPLPVDAVAREAALQMLRPDEPVVEPDAAVIVSTSGSTGAPKGVVLSRSAIVASVEATHRRLGGAGDWAVALPTHYVAGLMVLARAQRGGGQAIPVRSDLGDLATIADQMLAPRYISVVPTQLVRALTVPELTAALARFDAVLVGGGPLDAELRTRAGAKEIRVVATYGMSETCGGCFYDGKALDRVVARTGPDDRIAISGPTLFSGYRLRPDLTAASLEDGWLLTPDRGRLDGDRLVVAGRLDDVMITGGLKVDRSEVEQWVSRWAGSHGGEAVVLGIADPEWGTKIIALSDAAGSLADLQEFVRRQLPSYAAPRSLVHLDRLPRLASGKPDRVALQALAEAGR